MKPRKRDRRAYAQIPDFPLLTRHGVVQEDRRRLLERRVRDMQVGWFKA